MRDRFELVVTDGGRESAGFMGSTRDCVCRAVALVTGRPYMEVYDVINAEASRERSGSRKRGRRSSARAGVFKATTARVMDRFGLFWTPTMRIGSGCTVHLRPDELPQGVPLVVSVSGHVTAVVDGKIHDTHDPARDGTRCVYGYWTPRLVKHTHKDSTEEP